MKKLILLIGLLGLLISSYGQLQVPAVASSGQASIVYETEYQTVYDAMTNKPTSVIADAQNAMVKRIVDTSAWVLMDVFYVFAQYSNSDSEALLNWPAPSGDDNCTNVSATAWVSLEGFTGDAVADYLSTNFNASTEAVNFTQDGATIGSYTRLDKNELTVTIGATSGIGQINLFPRSSGNFGVRLNSTSSPNHAVSTSLGMFIAVRKNSTEVDYFQNGSNLITKTVSSTGIPDDIVEILARGGGLLSTNQVSVAFLAGLLTEAQIVEVTAAIEEYMDSNSKGVDP